MRVRVRTWHGVASWLWVANDENCGICRMAFNGCCPDCPAALPHVPAGVEVQGVMARYTSRRRGGLAPVPAAGRAPGWAALNKRATASPVSRVPLRSGSVLAAGGTRRRRTALRGAGGSMPGRAPSLTRSRRAEPLGGPGSERLFPRGRHRPERAGPPPGDGGGGPGALRSCQPGLVGAGPRAAQQQWEVREGKTLVLPGDAVKQPLHSSRAAAAARACLGLQGQPSVRSLG
ncbi:anaphase-promoting complex subunit 11 isoform X1 [Falco peregrinus]|uniref:anaphase-promoting complex subunit 11 isoform X1 n=1 Tax=Falco peregrinus TaxID=8954 RepID=UPI00247A54FC|nr:anaphase-promoting complex subunit 11 isoform X1 [Falco peregrinus]